LLGDPRGLAPLASLAEAEKPKGFFGVAVHGGLPLCETCPTTPRTSEGLVVLRGEVCEWNYQSKFREGIWFDDGTTGLRRAGISEGCRGERNGKSLL